MKDIGNGMAGKDKGKKDKMANKMMSPKLSKVATEGGSMPCDEMKKMLGE